MSLGFVIGESKPTIVTAITSRALSVGEYIKIGSDEGEILGLVERSSVSSAAFTDVRNFDEASESTEIADLNKRDKTFTAHIGILGFFKKFKKRPVNHTGNSSNSRHRNYFAKQTRLGRNIQSGKRRMGKHWKSFTK